MPHDMTLRMQYSHFTGAWYAIQTCHSSNKCVEISATCVRCTFIIFVDVSLFLQQNTKILLALKGPRIRFCYYIFSDGIRFRDEDDDETLINRQNVQNVVDI